MLSVESMEKISISSYGFWKVSKHLYKSAMFF